MTTKTRTYNSTSYTASFFLLCTLLEEDFAKNVLLLAERVIILDVVVVGLVKHAV